MLNHLVQGDDEKVDGKMKKKVVNAAPAKTIAMVNSRKEPKFGTPVIVSVKPRLLKKLWKKE